MKEKGLLDSILNEEGDPDWQLLDADGNRVLNPDFQMPPRVNIITESIPDVNLPQSGQPPAVDPNRKHNHFLVAEGEDFVEVKFLASLHFIKEAFANVDGYDILSTYDLGEQVEPNVQREPEDLTPDNKNIRLKWEVFGPDSNLKSSSSKNPPEIPINEESNLPDYHAFKNQLDENGVSFATHFANFTNSLNPSPMVERRITRSTRPTHNKATLDAARQFSFQFRNDGIYEIYCTLNAYSSQEDLQNNSNPLATRVLMTMVTIGNPVLMELPAILDIPRAPNPPILKAGYAPQPAQERQERQEQPRREEPSIPPQPRPPEDKGI